MSVYDTQDLYISTDKSLAADFYSAAHETRYHDMGAIQLWWETADAVTGTFIVQFSLDNIHWSDSVDTLDASTVCAASGVSYFEFADVTCAFWRVKYTANTVTTGTVTILSSIKRRR